MRKRAIVVSLGLALILLIPTLGMAHQPSGKAVVITCTGMIDDGLYRSIRRRSDAAIQAGARYLIYQIGTYGGLAEAADNISKYLILEASKKARTVAYVSTEAISAGAMVAVSCQDVIMRTHTTIGDCAPIALGQKLEGVEREKTESFIRATFDRAAKANGYPAALLRAMVTMEVAVYKVTNRLTGKDEFFEAYQIPKDQDKYDLGSMELIDPNDRILTLDADAAYIYGIARAVVEDMNGLAAFLEQRDGVILDRPIPLMETNWSEEMVRILNHPVTSGLLLTIALIAIYVELSTPGIGLPGLVAVICLGLWAGSKYLTGLANWVEVILALTGVVLLLLELFVLPGFGLAGITGIICLIAGIFGMLVRNPPDRLPWPEGASGWQVFLQGATGLFIGIVGFSVFVAVAARYLPKWRLLGGLVLMPTGEASMEGLQSKPLPGRPQIGDVGVVEYTLRPAGKARFGRALLDCMAYGQFIEPGTKVRITQIVGNNLIVEPLKEDHAASA